MVFPHRRSFPHPLLPPSQEIQDFLLFPRPDLLVWWSPLGSSQLDPHLARRPCRLRLQLLRQEELLGMVVQVQLVSDLNYP